MRQRSVVASFLLLLVLLEASHSSPSDVSSLPSTSGGDTTTCSLYLAESSIPHAGWGVFAGRDFQVGESLEQPGIGIQVIDSDRLQNETVLLQYLWRSSVVGGFHEADKVLTFLPGVGSLANYHAGLANVMEGSLSYDPVPGGASTAYHNYSFMAYSDIKAGDELFLGGGRLHQDQRWEDYPRPDDYTRLKKLTRELVALKKKLTSPNEIQWIDVLYRLKNEMMQKESHQVRNMMPSTLEELHQLERKGPKAELLDRDFAWIQKHGYCLDYIREGESTVQGAGRGAFAAKEIKKGAVIAPAPLLPVNLTAFVLDHRGPYNRTVQLLGNYCFGHAASDTIAFCPLSQITLINHNDKPNAAIRWGKPSKNRRDDDSNLLTMSLVELEHHFKRTGNKTNAPLLLEVYALEDIHSDQEIFVNYGSQWDKALSEHTRAGERTAHRSTAISYVNVNDSQEVIYTEELEHSVSYQCRIEPLANEDFRGKVEEEDYRGRPHQHPHQYSDFMKVLFGNNIHAAWYPCNIIGSYDGSKTLIADVKSKGRSFQRTIRRFENLPREAVRIVPAPYQSEQHSKDSFRLYIPIPDSLFPVRWRKDYGRARDLRLGRREKGKDLSLAENKFELELLEKKVREAKCGAYFAPSNIPEAGFSQYTAVSYAGSGAIIGSHTPSIVIPGIFSHKNRWSISDYVWEGKTYRAEYEVGKDLLSETLGASLANFHPGILNMGIQPPEFQPMLDTCKDPGAGASSDYIGCGFISRQVLQPGEELFVNYGDNWFLSRPEFGDIAVSYHYKQANNILASIWGMISVGSLPIIRKSEVSDVISFVTRAVIEDQRTLSALKYINGWKDLENVIAKNGTAQATMELRSLDWLEEHGQCMDHIYLNKSTISQAGQGAFTRRFLSEGTTIISSPMIHVWGRESMKFDFDIASNSSEINPWMQLLNYEFSHPKSSVYFLPINQMIGINHNSERLDSGKPPNARLRWATWNSKSNYMLQRPLEDLKRERYSTMVIDIIASRDIEVDEEIFIDYGIEWENSWLNHLAAWKSPCSQGRMSARFINDMNKDKHNTEYHSWTKDHFTVCWKHDTTDFELIYIVASNVTNAARNQEGYTITHNYNGIMFGDDGFEYSSFDDVRIPCKLWKSHRKKKTFEAVLFFHHISAIEVHRAIPESSVDFIPKPYRSDMHLPGAFRHEIKIPDDIFPHHWMDLEDY